MTDLLRTHAGESWPGRIMGDAAVAAMLTPVARVAPLVVANDVVARQLRLLRAADCRIAEPTLETWRHHREGDRSGFPPEFVTWAADALDLPRSLLETIGWLYAKSGVTANP